MNSLVTVVQLASGHPAYKHSIHDADACHPKVARFDFAATIALPHVSIDRENAFDHAFDSWPQSVAGYDARSVALMLHAESLQLIYDCQRQNEFWLVAPQQTLHKGVLDHLDTESCERVRRITIDKNVIDLSRRLSVQLPDVPRGLRSRFGGEASHRYSGEPGKWSPAIPAAIPIDHWQFEAAESIDKIEPSAANDHHSQAGAAAVAVKPIASAYFR